MLLLEGLLHHQAVDCVVPDCRLVFLELLLRPQTRCGGHRVRRSRRIQKVGRRVGIGQRIFVIRRSSCGGFSKSRSGVIVAIVGRSGRLTEEEFVGVGDGVLVGRIDGGNLCESSSSFPSAGLLGRFGNLFVGKASTVHGK